ncbi:MAG TPA: helix-turn-helix domain-containing protein [Anaeromyxobacter sp.]|nr:helix-turn-helix domain-containing protein [Anaeromyxobacter sp.]
MRLRARLREETARAILASAEQVLAEEGLHAARMERIAAQAGVAVGTLYNHFQDREALLDALATQRRVELLGKLDGALAATEGRPVRERLRAFLAALADHARAHGRFLQALVQAGEGPVRARPPAPLLDALVSRAEVALAAGVAAGELRPDPAGVAALSFVSLARTVVLRVIAEQPDRGADTLEAVLELFLRGAAR